MSVGYAQSGQRGAQVKNLGALANGLLPVRRISRELAAEEQDEENRVLAETERSGHVIEAEFKSVPVAACASLTTEAASDTLATVRDRTGPDPALVSVGA